MKNYFNFFDIAEHPLIDEAGLRKRFLLNSKKYHPDFYTLESEEKQKEILELSTLNNQAYKVLSDFDKRLEHLLRLKGCLGKEGENKLPQSFLMEMMDINEGIMELEFDASEENFKKISQSVSRFEEGLKTDIKHSLESYKAEDADGEILEQLKNYHLKKKYLLRIQENLSKFASH